MVSFFRKTSLKALGLRIQLGNHPPGDRCPGAQSINTFIIVDGAGVHDTTVDFCACHGAAEQHVQLLRRRLYPATFDNPSTAFSFQLLRDFLAISFNTRLSQLHFMDFLRQKMDNSGLRDIPVGAVVQLASHDTNQASKGSPGWVSKVHARVSVHSGSFAWCESTRPRYSQG
jgi:hypothetical protein